MKTVSAVLSSLLLSACAGAPKSAASSAAAPAPTGVPDRSLGLSKTSPFEVPEPSKWAFVKESPGGNDRLARAFPISPPRIPHDVTDYLPITATKNRCLQCHDVEKAATPDDPTPIPASHRIDLRNAPEVKKKEVSGARWICTACHVPQAQADPPVGNTF
jgi:cytochrome c-type protein NapB